MPDIKMNQFMLFLKTFIEISKARKIYKL